MKKTKVALLKCESLETEKIKRQIERGIELLGGISKFAKKGENILLKPNLLVASSPESVVTTHPSLFAAVAEVFLEAGAHLSYGDSPGLGTLEFTSKKCGISSEAARLGIKTAEFKKHRKVEFPGGKQNKSFRIAAGALEADGIISLPKMKPHGLMRITGAVKNQYGCLPGLQKGEYHWKFAKRGDFAQMLVDLTLCVKPRLYIMDGILAMEVEGPRSGVPIRMNTIIMGTDPVAVDAVYCRLINLPPDYVLTNTLGRESGLGEYDLSKIEIAGDPPEELENKNYRIERKPVKELNKGPSAQFLRNLLIPKPKIRKQNCTRCGDCVKICPSKPVSLAFKKNARKNPPEFNYKTCIRCYCCFEICPSNAIYLTSLLRKSRKRLND